jgi:hypothetical protein
MAQMFMAMCNCAGFRSRSPLIVKIWTFCGHTLNYVLFKWLFLSNWIVSLKNEDKLHYIIFFVIEIRWDYLSLIWQL